MADDAPTAAQQLSEARTGVPQSARIWNHWLGGRENHEADRAAAERYREVYPEVVRVARSSRHFLIRSLRYLAGEAGVRQFLDIGAGLPTVDNTHEVVQRVDPRCRVVYVDNDRDVPANAATYHRTGTAEGATDCLAGDLREPGQVLTAASRTLDPGKPVGLILSGVLGHVQDDREALDIVRRLLDGLPSGSYLSLNDATGGPAGGAFDRAQREYDATGALPYRLRTPAQVADFLSGLDPVPPGVVPVSQWQPDISPFGDGAPVDAYGFVGRKP